MHPHFGWTKVVDTNTATSQLHTMEALICMDITAHIPCKSRALTLDHSFLTYQGTV